MEQTNKNIQAKKKIGMFLGAIAIIGAVYGGYWLLHGRNFVETDNAYINSNQNIVTSQVSGIIKAVYVEDTQNVKKGDLIAEIDDTDYKIALDEAIASLGKTVRAYSNLSSNVKVNSDSVEVKRSQYNKAKVDYDMDLKSYKAGLISKQQYETSKSNLEIAKASLNQSIKALEEAKIQADSVNIYSHPDVQKGIAGYKNAYLNYMKTKIYAPESGVVAKKAFYLGQQVAPSQQLLSIINLNDIWVDANYKETQLKNIKVGNEVEILSDINGKKYKGYVQGISGGSGSALSLLPAQNATGNWIKVVQRIPVRITLDKKSLEENGTLPIGSSVIATVDVKSHKDGDITYSSSSTNLYTLDENEINKQIASIIAENLNKK